ncbi:hypothetical protein G3I40_12365 [Streptomyces sp. SID14478]|uniref:hypothetical protein n=1 Tax=Streptomyces sp. SID14478 TaxID=2706073 RepID=UPI0013DC58EB|nr:hypothetical protein [Streptomyces sp. SID14478]NEB76009.1 hypothetical protein [Streptomyces sp. SID14478]
MPLTHVKRGRTRRTGAACALTTLVAAVALTGCGTEDLVGGGVARTGASQAGKAAFQAAGHPLKGKLTCSSDDTSDSRMVVTCTGTTEDGEPAKMTADLGTDSQVVSGDNPKVRGASITGTVGGRQVFKKDCIGNC